MKNIILKIPYIKALIEEARREGGIDAFPRAHKDILETMKDDLEARAEILAEQKLANLLSVVNYSDIVTLDKSRGLILIGGERIDEIRLNNLRAEAEMIEQTDIWKLLIETPKDMAHKALFVEGDNLDTMKKGRAMLYTLDSQEKIISLLKVSVRR